MHVCTIMHMHGVLFSLFSGNSGPNGIVSIGYAPAMFRGRTHFMKNQGASLRVCFEHS